MSLHWNKSGTQCRGTPRGTPLPRVAQRCKVHYFSKLPPTRFQSKKCWVSDKHMLCRCLAPQDIWCFLAASAAAGQVDLLMYSNLPHEHVGSVSVRLMLVGQTFLALASRSALVCFFCSTISSPKITANDNFKDTVCAHTETGSFQIAQERTFIGQYVSGPLIALALGLAFAALGILPLSCQPYRTVYEGLLPLATALLLLEADLKR